MTNILNSLMSGGYVEDYEIEDGSWSFYDERTEDEFEKFVLGQNPVVLPGGTPIETDELPF